MTAANPSAPLLVDVDRLSELLGVGRTYAWALVRSGTIPSCKIGRLRLVAMGDVEAFVESRFRDDGTLGQHS